MKRAGRFSANETWSARVVEAWTRRRAAWRAHIPPSQLALIEEARRSSKLHLVLLVRKLDIGGAERQALELSHALSVGGDVVTIVSFYDGGELLTTGLHEQVCCVGLGKRGRWNVLPFAITAYDIIRMLRPDVLYGYQSVANELSLLIGRLVGVKVAWGIRASNMDLGQYDRLSTLMFLVGAYLSRFVDVIIVNSDSGARHCERHGYNARRMVVVPNGINTARFKADLKSAAILRREWALEPCTPLVGIVARLDPMKDHETFLDAAALVRAIRPDVRFVCVGDGAAAYRRVLVERSRELGLASVLQWTGEEHRIAGVMTAIDVLCSSSAFGEGFSNVVAEAMACGTSCVVTDVGDSAKIVGPTGVVVPPRSPHLLAEALLHVLASDPKQRRERGVLARQRIVQHFSIDALCENTRAALVAEM